MFKCSLLSVNTVVIRPGLESKNNKRDRPESSLIDLPSTKKLNDDINEDDNSILTDIETIRIISAENSNQASVYLTDQSESLPLLGDAAKPNEVIYYVLLFKNFAALF